MMNADKDEWQQLVTALGEGALQYLNSDDDGRSAAIIQLKAVLQFLHAMDQKILTTPLHNLLNALMDLQYAKPAKILEPKKPHTASAMTWPSEWSKLSLRS